MISNPTKGYRPLTKKQLAAADYRRRAGDPLHGIANDMGISVWRLCTLLRAYRHEKLKGES